MEYNFKDIEERWHQYWVDNKTYRVTEDTSKPKFYVLDMFPYPSGAGLHVGHPLGYIASDIITRYKRLKGFNVLHPMGYDAYGLPAEQYAIQTGQHPAITTEKNIKRYKEQLDRIGFSFDWDREIRTCEPEYYHWTQWAFVQMFNSYYCNDEQEARPIDELISVFEQQGSTGLNIACSEELIFTAEEWNTMSEHDQQEMLLNYRIAYLSDTKVNWCPALGTVLANDEVINGLSERGGHPVEQRMMRQWSLRVSSYAERLLTGLDAIDWSESIKETQRNWIGKSVGAEIYLPLAPSDRGGIGKPMTREEVAVGEKNTDGGSKESSPYYTTNKIDWHSNIENAREHRINPTEAENALWQLLRNKNLGYKFRRQHLIDQFIVDFLCLEKQLVIEVDGKYHSDPSQKEADEQRTKILEDLGYQIIRFSNEEVIANTDEVINKIKGLCDAKVSSPLKMEELATRKEEAPCSVSNVPSAGGDLGEVTVFTTRPDTIYGVTFMVLAPESDYVSLVTTAEQKKEIDDYIEATKKRTERERMADKKVSGVFTGSYAINPINGEEIPIWISDYVLAGYGTGAIMAVPAHDSRDYDFAKHFGLEIRPLIAGADVSEESFDAKEGTMINSGFLNGLSVPEAIETAKKYMEEEGIGQLKTNYRLRDAIFSRQRYWGEPFPVYYKGDMPYMLPLDKLPLLLPEVDKYLPTEMGEPPLGRATVWAWDEANQVVVDKSKIDNKTIFPLELNTMPGFAGSSAYYLRYMDPHNNKALVSKEANEYWGNVDLYVGGTEHATGHLVYSRFWNKFLFDIGHAVEQEPFKKLVNQGMIQGVSSYVYRVKDKSLIKRSNLVDVLNKGSLLQYFNELVYYKKFEGIEDCLVDHNKKVVIKIRERKDSIQNRQKHRQTLKKKGYNTLSILTISDIFDLEKKIRYLLRNKSVEINKSRKYPWFISHNYLTFFENNYTRIHVDINFVKNNILDVDKFRAWRPEFRNAEFILEDGQYICGSAVEKMSKSYHNVVNPDVICNNYGADTLRLYEMFLGPLEYSKPWDTHGIDGVFRFLRRVWALFYQEGKLVVTDEKPNKEELKALHKLIKKVDYDIETFSFNTSVSAFMICVNELTALKCSNKTILTDLVKVLSPFAPFIAEELWKSLGNSESVCLTDWPQYNETYLIEDEITYAISFNGKARFNLTFAADTSPKEIEAVVLANEEAQKWIDGQAIKKVIVVHKKIVNVVV